MSYILVRNIKPPLFWRKKIKTFPFDIHKHWWKLPLSPGKEEDERGLKGRVNMSLENKGVEIFKKLSQWRFAAGI